MAKQTYFEIEHYLFERLPIYQNQGKAAFKPGLERIVALLKVLGNPHKKIKSVHIAGTNGKGSTANMLASVFQEQGYKTGLYTSPHLVSYRERIRINGQMIEKDFIISFVEQLKPSIEKINPSFFEITAAMAFAYFYDQKVDYAIIETGLGGRLDSTNVITPFLSVITNIGFDHMAILGDTIEKIAFEKAGIIKKNVPVVIGREQPEALNVFKEKSSSQNAKMHMGFDYAKKLPALELKGAYQQENLKTVLTSLEVLQEKGVNFDQFNIEKGLLNISKNTHFKGRFHLLEKSKHFLLDTAHNKDALSKVFKQVDTLDFQELHLVIGIVNDKDVASILQLLPKKGHYYLCAPNVIRALPVETLHDQSKDLLNIQGTYKTVKAAIKAAEKKATKNDLIYIGGSTFVVADAYAHYFNHTAD